MYIYIYMYSMYHSHVYTVCVHMCIYTYIDMHAYFKKPEDGPTMFDGVVAKVGKGSGLSKIQSPATLAE